MTISGRRRSAHSKSNKSRRQEFQRRALWAESLEPRALMDASGLTFTRHPFWNIQKPVDVNADGKLSAFDALAIINDLNLRGARSLATQGPATSAGEGPNTTGGNFVDVNNDNRVSAMDALQVINRLNSSGGEGEPLVKLTVQIVKAGTNEDLTEINKGGFYEMRILTEDLGVLTYMGETRPATNLGVATNFFDVQYDTTKTDVQTNDNQIVAITGSPTTNGTFTLTVNDNGTLKTTAPITFAANRVTTGNNIQAALNTLLKPTPTSPDTVEVTQEAFGGVTARWRVRFINKMGSQDVPEMTGNVSGLGTATLTVTEAISGELSNPTAYADALALRTRFDADGNPLNDDPPFYTDQRNGSAAAFGINDLGGSALNALVANRYPGTTPTEIARIHMDAKQASDDVFITLSMQQVLDGLETGVVGFGNAITADLVTIVGDHLKITAPLSAGPDSGNTTEGASAPIDIDVLANDVNNAPTPNTAKSIVSLNTTGLVGTASIVTVGGVQKIRYTPPGAASDFNGPTTLTYVVTDQNNNTDTGTVTINVAAVNDAPIVTGPTSQNINEDTLRVFNAVSGNQIQVNDVDAPSAAMGLTLSVTGGGALTLGGTAGLTGTTGNGTNTITTSGTLADLNTALEGLSYLPASNSNGTFTLTVTVNDNGQTGTGGSLQGTKNITLNVAAINDAPTVDISGVVGTPSVVEGDPLVFNATNAALIQVADADAGASPVLVTLHVATGNTIHVNTTTGVTIGTNDTNNVTLTGNLTDVNTALNGFTYTAALGAATPDTLQVTINDQGNTGSGGPQSGSQNVTIDVVPATRPRARNDVLTVTEDSSAGLANTIDVLGNDIVNLPGPPTVKAELITFQATSVNGGTITLDNGGTAADFTDDKLVYVPAPDFFGIDSFTYTMNDTTHTGADSTGTVNVTVTAVNDTPVAQNDPLSSIAEDSGALTILASTLTGNDSRGAANESAQTLTIASVSNAVGGTVSINGSGNVVFTPAADFNGPASFTYTVQDNGQTNGANDFKTSAPATVSFTITEVNDAPTAPNQTLTSVAEDTATVTIPFATLLAGTTAGAANENAQTLTVSAVSAPVGGTVNIVGTDVIFTPTANFNGNASFTFTVTDNGTTNGTNDPKSTNATASFTITPVNDAPNAVDDTATTGEGQQINVSILANDRDVDVNPPTGTAGQLQAGTTIAITSGPTVAQGTASVVGNQIQFTPAVGFFGPVTIQYQLNDNTGAANQLSNVATLTIDVVEKNDPPVANPDPGIVTAEDTLVSIDVFGNDNDPDTAKANWSFALVTPPAHGTAMFNATTRQVDYTPDSNYNGPDSFVYKINDNSPINPQNLDSGNALVSINVTEVNDAPVGGTDPVSGQYTVIKDRDRTFTTTELLANDSAGPANESSQTISITGVTAASTAGGTVTLNGGNILYTPAAGYIGNDSFTYTLTDNGTTNGSADPKSVQVTVNIIVRDFIPTDVNGFVFRDVNNNGTYQVGIDYPLSGVDVTLTGTSDVTGAITPITVETDSNGFYQFLAVEPGTYHIKEAQPVALGDGPETLGLAASFFANDDISLTLPLLGVTGGVSRNNFAEGGIDASKLVNAGGLVSESLSSSSSNGFVLATTLAGSDIWSWKLNGWTNATDMQITLDADKSAATMVVNGYSLRIFVNPNDPRNANRLNPDPVARLARFRILGWDAAGNYMIRLDGTASDFYGSGHPLAAAPAPLSGGEYVDGVDAAMAEDSWA